MSVSRPPVLAAGDQVRFRGGVRSVARLAGGVAYLAGMAGAESAVALADLFADPQFALLAARRRAPLSPEGLLDGLPAEVADRARWWERHMAEVIGGLPAVADAGLKPGRGPCPARSAARTAAS